MEALSERFAKYVYIILMISTGFHLADAILVGLEGLCQPTSIILILLSLINVMLLGNSLKFNKRKQYTECKVTTKILCITMAALLLFHIFCAWNNASITGLRNSILALSLVELALGYRISCIEYLEKRADQFAKENMMNIKEDK